MPTTGAYRIPCFTCDDASLAPAFWCMPCKCVLCDKCFSRVVQQLEIDGEESPGLMMCPHGEKIKRTVLFDRRSGKVLLDGSTFHEDGVSDDLRVPDNIRHYSPMEDWGQPMPTEEDIACKGDYSPADIYVSR